MDCKCTGRGETVTCKLVSKHFSCPTQLSSTFSQVSQHTLLGCSFSGETWVIPGGACGTVGATPEAGSAETEPRSGSV